MRRLITNMLAPALALVLASPFAFGQTGGGSGGREGAGGAGTQGSPTSLEQVAGGGPGVGLAATGGSWLTGRAGASDQTGAAALSGVGPEGLPRNILPPPFHDLEVQKKLNITPDQLGRLGEAGVRLRLALKGALRDTEQMSRAAAAVRSDELLLKYNSDLMRAVAQIFEARQMERYRQLSRASEGLLTFTDPDVARGLKLTEKQEDRLKELRQQTDKKLTDLVQKAGSDVSATLAQAGRVRSEAMAQVGPILQPNQKDAFAKMTGYHFAQEGKSGSASGGADRR
jgi:hypothetical protein